jgi:hypothetical protein
MKLNFSENRAQPIPYLIGLLRGRGVHALSARMHLKSQPDLIASTWLCSQDDQFRVDFYESHCIAFANIETRLTSKFAI